MRSLSIFLFLYSGLVFSNLPENVLFHISQEASKLITEEQVLSAKRSQNILIKFTEEARREKGLLLSDYLPNKGEKENEPNRSVSSNGNSLTTRVLFRGYEKEKVKVIIVMESLGPLSGGTKTQLYKPAIMEATVTQSNYLSFHWPRQIDWINCSNTNFLATVFLIHKEKVLWNSRHAYTPIGDCEQQW